MKIVQPITIVDSNLTSSDVTENDYAAYSAGTTYAINAFVIYVATNIHKIYQSLVGSNLGNPVTDATKWLDCGSTNRWKLHDTSVQSQTSKATSIANVYAISGRCNSVALLNVDAASVTVSMTDATDGVVYDNTVSLVSTSGIQDWYAYFFETIVRKSDLALTDLPSYSNTSISVTISAPSGTALCGGLIFGNSRDIGGTQYGVKVGITDYSTKTQDAFGNYTITRRAYRKTGEFSLDVNSGFVDQLQATLANFRATPILYIGSDDYASTLIYGFYKDFSISIAYPTMSLCSITIEGLT